MKHTYLAAAASATVGLSMALAPLASFAAAPYQQHPQPAQHQMPAPAAQHKSIFGDFLGFFGGRQVRAAGDATVTPARNMPPSISGVSSPTVLDVGATGTWTVSASDPQNGNLSYSVNWGDQGGGIHPLALMQNAFVQTSSFTHAYANPGTYTVTFTVKDDAGLSSTSTVTVHVVQGAIALAIANVSAAATSPTRATVTWTTNAASNSAVFYSTATPVDTSSALSATANGRVLNHQVTLTKLIPATTYYYIVESKDARGEMATSVESSFTTPAAANTGDPTISSVSGPQTIDAGTQGTWTIAASDPANSTLTYSVDWGDESMMGRIMAFFAPQKVFIQTSTFTHTYANPGTYTITVTAKDTAGLSATSTTTVAVTAPSTTTPPATTTPVISGITALVGDNGITFNWNTDSSADSEVYYSATSPVTIGGSGTTPVTDGTLATSHSVAVSGLSEGTPYYFIVESKDANGDTAATNQFTVTTMSM